MLRSQADEQERTLKDQEDELHQRKQELDSLKSEEQRLESSLKNSEIHHEELNSNLQETHLLISQVRYKDLVEFIKTFDIITSA
jgi:chromosome segregation ATPase